MGAVYQENWQHAQTGLFDPQAGLGNIGFGTNGANYQVRGGELQIVRQDHGRAVDSEFIFLQPYKASEFALLDQQ